MTDTEKRIAEIEAKLNDTWWLTLQRDDTYWLISELRASQAECAKLGAREPTQAEGDAAEGTTGLHPQAGECFIGCTGRRCLSCHEWTWGGPTKCVRCVVVEERDAAQALLAEAVELLSRPQLQCGKWQDEDHRANSCRSCRSEHNQQKDVSAFLAKVKP